MSSQIKRSSSEPSIAKNAVFRKKNQSIQNAHLINNIAKNNLLKKTHKKVPSGLNKLKVVNSKEKLSSTQRKESNQSSISSFTIKLPDSKDNQSKTNSSIGHMVLNFDGKKFRNLSLTSYTESRVFSTINMRKEKIQLHLCRAKVLLVTMLIGLGLSMLSLGLYLKYKLIYVFEMQCEVWAAIPVLLNGTFGLVYCIPKLLLYIQKKDCLQCVKFISILLSLTTIVTSIISAIKSGVHGNWLVLHHNTCNTHLTDITHPDSSSSSSISAAAAVISIFTNPTTTSYNPITQILTNAESKLSQPSASLNLCCVSNISSCLCGLLELNNQPPILFIERSYINLNCSYVLSSLKDYLILHCALYTVSCGVAVWFGSLMLRSCVVV